MTNTSAAQAEAQAYKTITWRIMPFLFFCYVLAYVDRVNVGFAKLQMQQDLGMSDSVYGLGAGIFFIGYFLFEVPANMILQRIGAHHIVQPESDAGTRVAHLVSGKLLDYIEVEDGFTIVKMRPPMETQGFTVAQTKVQEKYGVTVIGVKSPGHEFVYAEPTTRISANDLLIVSGHADLLERFAARP